MRKFIPGSLLIILPGIILLLFSCTPGSCMEETEAYLKASFYKGVGTAKLTPPDSLTVYGLNDTAKVYNKATKVEHALLPLNASTAECTFIVKINGVIDTIKFRYTSYPHLLSKECGYTYYHELDTVREYTKHLIKNIYTSNRTITTSNVENISIYY